jgi:PQQ-dependent catabolism-associated CXXCW motif protein
MAVRRLAALLMTAMALAVPCQAQVPEPADYRLDDYRSPTPATLKGAAVVGAVELHQMLRERPVVLVDVLPQPPRPDKLPPTVLWRPPTRYNIPGSVWLANVGYGRLSPSLDEQFRQALERLSLGDRRRAIVFYCDAECWMSWNAAKRAVGYGYAAVYWFPGGMQEWIDMGYPTLRSQPVPLD